MVVSVMLHFPHWTWEKKLERGEKGEGAEKGGTRDGMDLGEGRTCAVQFCSPRSPVGTV